MKQIYFPDFIESIAYQAEYLEAEAGGDVATRFINCVQKTTDRLARSPLIGFTREFENEKLKHVRIWRVSGFERFFIFYLLTEDSISFLHLIHSAQDYTRIFADD